MSYTRHYILLKLINIHTQFECWLLTRTKFKQITWVLPISFRCNLIPIYFLFSTDTIKLNNGSGIEKQHKATPNILDFRAITHHFIFVNFDKIVKLNQQQYLKRKHTYNWTPLVFGFFLLHSIHFFFSNCCCFLPVSCNCINICGYYICCSKRTRAFLCVTV